MSKDTKRVGAIGELHVAKKFLELGFEVFREISDNSKIDLIVIKDNILSKIQVKTVSKSNDKSIGLARWKTTSGKKIIYTKDDVDFIATFIVDKNIILLVPIEKFVGREFFVHFSKPKNGRDFVSFEQFLM